MHDVNKVNTYLQLFTEICGRNSRLLDIFLKLYHLIYGMQRMTWNCIDTPLHVLYNNTATLIQIPCFDLIINKNTNSQSHFMHKNKKSKSFSLFKLNSLAEMSDRLFHETPLSVGQVPKTKLKNSTS
jgi:hypothetical protein